jgi:NADPH2:quinone reductase
MTWVMSGEKTPRSSIKERHLDLQVKHHPTSSLSDCPQIMSTSTTSPQNTSSTPNDAGRWVVTEFGTPSVLKWQSFNPATELSPIKNVQIRILVAGIGGVDNIQRAGGYPDPLASRPGFTPGYDLVGEVISLHHSTPAACKLQIGDRVTSLCCFGAHATHIVLPWEDIIKIRPDDDMLKICALPLNYMTAWGMLKHSGVSLPPGSTILMGSASGGLGTAVAQLIRVFDMQIRIIGTCNLSKFKYVMELGVEPIDRNAGDLVEQVRKLTGGEGVDVAFDGVCSEESVRSFEGATKEGGGRTVIFGVSTCQWP